MARLMDRAARALALLLAVLFVGMGLRWLVDPAGAAAGVGMTLLIGAGLATQIADLASFFLTAGTLGLVGLILRRALLLQVAGAMVGAAAPFRIVAWLVHDAALTLPIIVFELITLVVFLRAARAVATAR
jgi:hypothetical protein